MANEALYQDDVDTLTDDEYGDESPLDEARFDEAQGYDAPAETGDEHEGWAPADEDVATPFAGAEQPTIDPLEQLPLELTLRCGALTLTLGELQRIGAGSVIEIAGIAPGHATLCHGERVVAEGELVDVDGRLGLQITGMATQR
jgi:type III secretion protein Q